MSSKQEDENYWNHSDFKPFSFDDEELGSRNRLFGNTISTSFLTDIIFDGISAVQKPQTQKRPLESLISKQSLSKIFGDIGPTTSTNLNPQEELKILRRQINNQWIPTNASKTVRLILTGQKYSLHLYKSLALKKELLDEAIKSGDGNAVLAVVLFLSSTLKKSLFYQILQTRPAAVSHYVQYLTTRIMVSELIDLLEMLSQTREAAMKQFTFIVQGVQNKETKLQRLNTCLNNHFAFPDSKDKQFLQDYIQYLQFGIQEKIHGKADDAIQICIILQTVIRCVYEEWMLSLESTERNAVGNSVLSSLSYLCKNHWDEPKTSKLSPWFLSSQHNISDRQLQWTILSSRASTQSWEDIDTYFFTKGWIGGKKLKTIISVEKIIMELNHQGAPYNIIVQYLEVIGNLEKRLEIAKQLSCHKAAIDVLILMKDRQGIVEYKMNLKPHSEDILYAENALRTQIKWKN